MTARRAFGLGLFLAAATAGCATTKVTTLPGGGFRITCDGLSDCATRAEKICGQKGVSVLAARSNTKILGGTSSNYQVASTTAFLEGVCGEPKVLEAAPGDEEAVYAVKPSEPEAVPNAGRACVPGASQKCFGPGACEGGQACLADGSGFGACECAAAVSPAPAVAPAPALSAAPAAVTGTP